MAIKGRLALVSHTSELVALDIGTVHKIVFRELLSVDLKIIFYLCMYLLQCDCLNIMHIQARLPMHVCFCYTLNLTLLGAVDLAQKDAGQNQAGDEQDQIDKGKHKSCDAQGGRSGRCTEGRGG